MRQGEATHRLHLGDREVPDNVIDLVPVKNKVQIWASQNAYTLVFLSVMFFITWVILIVAILQNWVGN